MRVGVIGLGRIGLYHARILRAHPDVASLAVIDVDPERTRAAADELGSDPASSVDELLGRVDAVVIATSTDTHAALIHASVDAGLPVFCEKPVALDLASTMAVAAHVRAANATVQIGFQRRFDAGYGAARRAVSAGNPGRGYAGRDGGHDPQPPRASRPPGSGGRLPATARPHLPI